MPASAPSPDPKQTADIDVELHGLLRKDGEVVGLVVVGVPGAPAPSEAMAAPASDPASDGTGASQGAATSTPEGTPAGPGPSPKPASTIDATTPSAKMWALKERPLATVLSLTSATWPKQTLRRIHAAWSRMEECEPSAESLADLLLVCIETIPATAKAGPSRRIPPWPTPPPPHKATAAHPRAFKGTHARPPARPQPDHLDLRLFSSSAHALVEARRQLAPYLDEASVRLGKLGYDPARIRALPVDVDPYLGYHFGFVRRSLPALPQAFSPLLAPTRRWGHDQKAVADWLRLFFSLDLSENEPLRTAILRLALAGEHARTWCDHLVAEAPRHRLAFAQAASGANVARLAAPPEGQTFFAELRNLGDAEDHPERLHIALRELGRGVAPGYLQTGFVLAHRYEIPLERLFEYETPPKATSLAHHLLERIFDPRLDAATTDWARLCIKSDARHMYRCCGELIGDGAEQVLRDVDVGRVAPDVLEDFVRVLLRLEKSKLPSGRKGLRATWHNHHRALFLQTMYRAPVSHASRCCALLSELLAFCEPADETLMEVTLPLVSRLCAPPFSTAALQPSPLYWLLIIEETRSTVLAAKDETLKAIEETCLSHASAWVVTRGLYAISGRFLDDKPLREKERTHELSTKLRRFFADSFARYPTQALEAAAAWGAPEPEHARTLIARFIEHPLMADDLLASPFDVLISKLAEAASAGLHNAVPRKLRLAKNPLSSAQKERGLQKIADQLPLTRLDLLAQIAFDALGAPLAGKLPRQALAYLREAEENRRSYRAFLLAYNKGHHRYRIDHPKTAEWQRKHPRIPLERFAAGMEMRAELPSLGEVTLGIEQDPFEVLELGRYGQTCLQPGGIMSHSAISILLDANKQVVYARNRRGKVVARQVVAVAEEEKLVCFSVYPSSVPPALERIFAAYDQALAKHVGIELLPPDTDYTIADLLGRNFYDDSAWDGKPRDDAT